MPRVHERSERAQLVTAAQLHGADLGDAAIGGGPASGFEVDHAEGHLVEGSAEVIEAALHGRTVANERSTNKCSVRWPRYHRRVPSTVRYRCTSCGNLTRFDVTTTRRTRAYHHFTVGGDLRIEDEEVLDERVESVECRWCGAAGSVEVLDDSVEPVTEG